MKAGLVVLVLVACLATALGQADLGFDGPQCTNTLGALGSSCRFSSECQCGRLEVDFIFLFDASGSMCDNLQAVKGGLKKFADALEAAQTVDYRFALLRFGGTPRWLTSWTTNVTYISTAVDGVTCNAGGRETGLETMRMAHQLAGDNSISRPSSLNGFDMSFRPGALPYHILCTDEDSDCPIKSANQFPVSQCDPCNGDQCEPPNSWPSSASNFWNRELANTFNILIGAQAAFAGWVSPNVGKTKFQYGPVAQQVGNFTFFNRTETIRLATAADALFANSLQIAMLRANLTARVYDITTINNPGAVEGFF